MKKISRVKAASLGLKRYHTGLPCCHGHVAERAVCNGECVECVRLRVERERKKRPELFRERVRRWQRANRAKAVECTRRWQRANAERVNENNARWYAKNRPLFYARNAARRESTRAAWMALSRKEREAITLVYECCIMISQLTGVSHHVDHKKPLSKGGKHRLRNLQIMPAKMNLKKHARVFS